MTQPGQLTLDASHRYLHPETRAETLETRIATVIPQFSVTSDLNSLEDEWRAFECDADCTPFQTFDWLSTWQQCIGMRAGVTPAIISGRGERGNLLFILPLAIEGARYLRRLSFLGHALCDYNAPLLGPEFWRQVSPATFAEFWRSAHAHLRRTYPHDVVLFDKMPKMVGSQPNPMHAFVNMLNPSSAHAASLGNDWEQFYSQKRSSATHRNDRKKRKKLAEFGEVRFVTAATPEAVREMFATLVAQKSRKFQRMGVPDLFAKPGYTQFFTSVAANKRSLVHVSALQVGSTLAATNLGLTFRGRYYYVLASYDEGPTARFGPGAAHLHELLRFAIAKKCTLFDFTIGDETYKLDWSDTKVALYDYVGGVGFIGRIAAMIIYAAFRAKRFIKGSPVIWRLTCRLRSAFGSRTEGKSISLLS
jgi:CelD/BcsL family acetyltransferase involved in cellulose biosynthesis